MAKTIDISQVAKSTPFDNTSNGFVATNVQSAIEEVGKGGQYIQFQYIGKMDYNQYLFSWSHSHSAMDRRSGDASTGYQWSASAPITATYTGSVVDATLSARGVAISVLTPATNVTVTFQLWKVGSAGEGTNLGNITFTIPSASYTIGAYNNTAVATAFGGNQSQSVSVSAGDLLGLKFISTSGNANAIAIENTTVVLHLQET